MTHPDDRQHHAVLERIPYDPVAWDAIVASHEDAAVYHTAAWLDYLAATQGAEPVLAVVRIDGRSVGYFVGAIVRHLGVRVLGSPLRGWGTQCMGFLLEDGIDRRAAADALIQFAFRDLRCLHVELADRKLSSGQMEGSQYAVELGSTYSIDLTKSEDVLLGAMQAKTRQKIRKALRGGLRVEDTSDPAFADEFRAFLTETFLRQGIGPTYDVGRVRQLIESLKDTGTLLLLRVRSPDGKVLAAGISVGGRRVAVSWGLAMPGPIRRRARARGMSRACAKDDLAVDHGIGRDEGGRLVAQRLGCPLDPGAARSRLDLADAHGRRTAGVRARRAARRRRRHGERPAPAQSRGST